MEVEKKEMDWEEDLRSGDQDYGSAIGWEPQSSTKKLIEEAKKKYPKAFAPAPEMLITRPVSKWMEMGVRVAPGEQLFGPLWQPEELAVLLVGTDMGESVLPAKIAE